MQAMLRFVVPSSKGLVVFAVVLAQVLALAAGSCQDQRCNCRPDISTEVRVYDPNGCYTCFCQAADGAPATAAAAPTTARATTRAQGAATQAPATTAAAATGRPACPEVLACNCRPGAVADLGFDSETNCPYCFCRISASTTAAPATTGRATAAPAPATTARATAAPAPATTARATAARTTTARLATAVPTVARCGALPACGCPTGVTITWATDSRGCPQQCSCGAAPSTVRASTVAATLAPAVTTRRQCPVVASCVCFRNEETPSWVTDASGCRSCVCLAPPSTTARAITVQPTSAAGPVCAPLAQRDNCECAPGSVKFFRTDAWGCLVCGCQASTTIATTARPTTARPSTTTTATTPRATTARATTRAPTTAAAATTPRAATTPLVSGACGTVRQCVCQPTAHAVWSTNSEGCPFCYCQANNAQASSAGASGSVDGSSGSGSSAVVPVVVALVCLCVAMVGVVAVYRYRSNKARMLEHRPSAQELMWDEEPASAEA
jgi:hypothetical protein